MSNVVKWDPFAELTSLQNQLFDDGLITPFKGMSVPTTDVYTQDNHLTVETHLPNFEHQDINVQIENNILIISAERHEKEEDKEKKYVVRESSNSFYRRIALPERADTDKIDAQLNDGVLMVVIPLTPLPEPKKISIVAKKK